jgi:hypothetical protein
MAPPRPIRNWRTPSREAGRSRIRQLVQSVENPTENRQSKRPRVEVEEDDEADRREGYTVQANLDSHDGRSSVVVSRVSCLQQRFSAVR